MSDEYFVVKRGQTVIPNATVGDHEISVPALGLLAWMLFMPPGASLGYRAFLGRGLGEKAIRNCLRELEAAGYRWRFQTRTSDGQLRTATVVFEEPTRVEAAWAAATDLASNRIEQCLTSGETERKNPLSHRADTGAARSDKQKRGTIVEDPASKAPSRTVQRSAVARSTAARSTVPRLSAAQPSNDGSKEPKGSPPDQTPPTLHDSALSGQTDQAGSGLDGLLDRGTREVSDPDWDVLVECLPPRMRRIEPSGIAKVAAALRKRVEAGWTPDALRAVLAGNSLPPDSEIQNLTGIVSYRIGQIPVRPPKRSKRIPVRSEPQPASPTVVPIALQKRAEARAEGSPDAGQPMSWWFEQYPPTKTDERGELA